MFGRASLPIALSSRCEKRDRATHAITPGIRTGYDIIRFVDAPFRKFIGVVTRGRIEQDRYSVNVGYCDAIRRAGGEPILLPPGAAHPADVLRVVNAVLLIGGGDIDVARYGGRPHPEISKVDAERDKSELEIVRLLAASATPTLAICRGIQVVNVTLGGTLCEHIPDTFGTAVAHQAHPPGRVPHDVEIQPASRLASVLGTHHCSVSSPHHQAIRDVAPGLSVTARSNDGVIEAVEKTDHPWFIAVQWHPEVTAARDPIQQRLFEALVAATR